MVKAAVHGNSVHPRIKEIGRLEIPDAAKDLNKNLLGEVLTFFFVAEDVTAVVMHTEAVFLREPLKCGLVPLIVSLN